jgi:hypothetical protein
LLKRSRGKNLEEGSIAKFRQAVEGGRIKTPCVLVIDEQSRFSRLKTWEHLMAFWEVVKLGVIVCTTANNGKVYTAESFNDLGELMGLSVGAQQSNSHAAEVSRKVGEAWKRKKERASEEILTTTAPA